MPEVLEHKSLGVKVVLKERITEGDMEKFGEHLASENTPSASQSVGAWLRAAIAAGWIMDPVWSPQDTLEMDPRAVRFIVDRLHKLYTELTTIPPA